MSWLLELSRVAVFLNLGFLGALVYVWGGNYRRHRAAHTFVMLIFAGFLIVQNVVWGVLYLLDTRYINWFLGAEFDLQVLLTFLCTFETVALAVLTWITWR